MTLEEMKRLPPTEQAALIKRIKTLRKPAKVTNYSSLYGVGKKKLARTTGLSEAEAQHLLDAFWEMNWSIKAVSEKAETKVLKDGSLWVKNPVSGFWHNLRNAKDVWSTLNQSTGVYVFDNWLAIIIQSGIPVIMQYHDEVLTYIPREEKDQAFAKFAEADRRLNQKLQLNVPVGSDYKSGTNYADVH